MLVGLDPPNGQPRTITSYDVGQRLLTAQGQFIKGEKYPLFCLFRQGIMAK